LPSASWVREEPAAYARNHTAPHVGHEEAASEAMRLALPNAGCVREEVATYEATRVGRSEGCAAVEHSATHVGRETSAGEAMRLALREGALPNAGWVRELATHAGRRRRVGISLRGRLSQSARASLRERSACLCRL